MPLIAGYHDDLCPSLSTPGQELLYVHLPESGFSTTPSFAVFSVILTLFIIITEDIFFF